MGLVWWVMGWGAHEESFLGNLGTVYEVMGRWWE